MKVYTHYLSLATEKFTGGSVGWVGGKESLNLVPDPGIIDLDWTGPAGPGLDFDGGGLMGSVVIKVLGTLQALKTIQSV